MLVILYLNFKLIENFFILYCDGPNVTNEGLTLKITS